MNLFGGRLVYNKRPDSCLTVLKRTGKLYYSVSINAVGMIKPAIFNGVLWHTGVMQRVHRCATGVWGKVEKKREKIEK
jgi:hypothetical protein